MASSTTKQPGNGIADPATMEESLQTLAGRLANTAQVLAAWAAAAPASGGEGWKDGLRGRLQRASRQLELAVASLHGESVDEGEPRGRSAVNERVKAATVEHLPGSTPNAFGLRGRSEMISLVEFVGFVANLGKDGVLQVQAPDEEFVLQFHNRDLVFGSGRNPPGLRLGDLLVGNGVLTLPDLDRARSEAHRDEFLGETLMRLGLIEREVLDDALAQQITQMFGRMHMVGAGFDFQFEEGTQILVEADIHLPISHLLLESARLLDEGSVRRHRSVAGEVAREHRTIAGDGEKPAAAAPAPAAAGDIGRSSRALDTATLRTRLVDKLAQGDLDLPSLPDTTAQLLQLCWQSDVDAVQLWECVRRDQSLCAHLLRVANSAAFAPTQEITSVQLAITRLGTTKLREVALALTLDQQLFSIPGRKAMARTLWHQAAITSGFASRLGRMCLGSQARGGLLGLLLDVGKPIVLAAVGALETQRGEPFEDATVWTVLEELHARAGRRLAEQWGLPDWLQAVIEHHHDHAAAGDAAREAMVGSLAAALATWAEDHEAGDGLERLLAHPATRGLGIAEDALERLMGQREAVLEMASVYDA